MTLVVHPHFHGRRTGATSHVETMVTALSPAFEARAIGSALAPHVARIGWGELLRRLWREEVVWHAHRNHELLVGWALRLLSRRVRLVFTRHSVGPSSGLTRWAARHAERAVALTPQVARTLGTDSTVVGHGIDLARFHPPTDRAEALRALEVSEPYAVGVVGRIRPDKGQGDFVDALAPLLPAHPDWAALGIGLAKEKERPFLDALERRAKVRWLPEQPDIERWYRGLTILVQPSHEESYSLVLLEAMASGCCVVAARMPHYPSLIEDGRTGFLYPPGNVEALRRILARLMADPNRALGVGQAAAEEARRRFGAEHEAEALGRIYRSLTSPSPNALPG
jgi:mannosyltransferase